MRCDFFDQRADLFFEFGFRIVRLGRLALEECARAIVLLEQCESVMVVVEGIGRHGVSKYFKCADGVRKQFVEPQIKLHLDYMESELAKSPWFAGDEFMAADI